MALIPAHVIRLVLLGHTNRNADEWNIVLHAQGSGTPDAADLVSIATSVRDHFDTDVWGDSVVGTYFSPNTDFDSCTAYSLDTANHAIDIGISASLAGDVGGGTAGLPPECAMCVSLETGHAGRSFRGRSYLPAPSTNLINDNGSVDPTPCFNIATQYSIFLGHINGITYGGGGADSMVVGVLSVTRGLMTPITSCAVGNVVDVQRRRRNGEPESYSTHTV